MSGGPGGRVEAPREHVALNVYCWGRDEEDRLLAGCLGPLVRELRADGGIRWFWFTRFDARGPHVTGIFSGAPERVPDVRARLEAGLTRYLSAHASPVTLPGDELDRRHADCRGACLCAIDAEPGIARNNSFRFAPHAADGYPFRLAAGASFGEELRDLLTDECLWAIDQLPAASRTTAAVRWIAGLDGALRRAGEDPARYWRYHATTILLGLQERLDRDEERVLATLAEMVGERNRRVLARAWSDVEHGVAAWPGADRLAGMVAAADGRTQEERWLLLRTFNHGILAQLGFPVILRLPLLVYAWLRGLPDAPPA